MKGKLTLLVGAAIGYVAGTAAGRQRYEQLKQQAKRAMESPKVQEAAAEVQQKVADVASKATHAATDKLKNGSSESDPPSTSSRPSTATSPTSPTPSASSASSTGAPLE